MTELSIDLLQDGIRSSGDAGLEKLHHGEVCHLTDGTHLTNTDVAGREVLKAGQYELGVLSAAELALLENVVVRADLHCVDFLVAPAGPQNNFLARVRFVGEQLGFEAGLRKNFFARVRFVGELLGSEAGLARETGMTRISIGKSHDRLLPYNISASSREK